ncbi:MAG: trypsin-like peptidase domain-containing protein [Clostridia bacterium]|nr:trypsin-like peptidase domain-containing protein [Clostridia bacterium]
MKILIYAVCLVLVGVFSFAAGENANRAEEEIVNERISIEATLPSPIIPKVEESFPDVVEKVLPSVVGIEAVRRGSENTVSLGSGVIVSDMGFVITNHHVVGDKPYKIDVTLYDGTIKDGELCWSDRSLDVAVVKFEGEVPAVARMGEYESIRVGEDVFAIGNPLSLQFERSVTKGIVSAKNRTISIDDDKGKLYMEDLIQTDASINPGNSGGPLMNNFGEVIGINTVRVTSAEGMGFAVPVNICENVISALEEDGKFETPYLGLYAYTAQTAKYLRGERPPSDGLYVISLDVKGPAYEGGIRYGDIITGINGVKVKSMLELRRELFKYNRGDEIALSVVTRKDEKEITVTVDKLDNIYSGANQ